jgi:hypothetical protein
MSRSSVSEKFFTAENYFVFLVGLGGLKISFLNRKAFLLFMQKRLLLFVLLIFLVSCAVPEETVESTPLEIPASEKEIEEIIVEETSDQIIGPGGCTGSVCDEYFRNNPEESQKWCSENPAVCNLLKSGDDSESLGPGGCLDDCEEFCDTNPDECEQWCSQNLAKSPELCGFMAMGEEARTRQGDGVWEKNELTFFIKDEEGVLSVQKRKIIIDTIVSIKKGSGGWFGWNSALEELNRLYPDNIVPDKMVEVNVENNADFILAVHSVKEFCCDLTGDPITGREMSSIDDNSAKIVSTIDAYNIINIDNGFLEDMMRHEIGHGLGIFSHVTNRNNDLMSIVSPASVIKKGNLDDLYVKYRDRAIETVEESRQADESVADKKVTSPS